MDVSKIGQVRKMELKVRKEGVNHLLLLEKERVLARFDCWGVLLTGSGIEPFVLNSLVTVSNLIRSGGTSFTLVRDRWGDWEHKKEPQKRLCWFCKKGLPISGYSAIPKRDPNTGLFPLFCDTECAALWSTGLRTSQKKKLGTSKRRTRRGGGGGGEGVKKRESKGERLVSLMLTVSPRDFKGMGERGTLKHFYDTGEVT